MPDHATVHHLLKFIPRRDHLLQIRIKRRREVTLETIEVQRQCWQSSHSHMLFSVAAKSAEGLIPAASSFFKKQPFGDDVEGISSWRGLLSACDVCFKKAAL